MKLLYILARELKAWPENSEQVWQSLSGRLFLGKDRERLTVESYTLAKDWDEARVTRGEWQAAVEALKAEQAAELKWPDGAEFVGTTKEGEPKVFYRNIGESPYEYRYENDDEWSESGGCPVHAPLIPRPTERAVEWDGSSFPPQYTICEWRDDEDGEWKKVKVLYLSAGTALLEFPDEPGICEGAFRKSDCQFRQIRTQEQIEDDERMHLARNALTAIGKDIEQYNSGTACSVAISATVQAMIKAGYRKQVAE